MNDSESLADALESTWDISTRPYTREQIRSLIKDLQEIDQQLEKEGQPLT